MGFSLQSLRLTLSESRRSLGIRGLPRQDTLRRMKWLLSRERRSPSGGSFALDSKIMTGVERIQPRTARRASFWTLSRMLRVEWVVARKSGAPHSRYTLTKPWQTSSSNEGLTPQETLDRPLSRPTAHTALPDTYVTCYNHAISESRITPRYLTKSRHWSRRPSTTITTSEKSRRALVKRHSWHLGIEIESPRPRSHGVKAPTARSRCSKACRGSFRLKYSRRSSAYIAALTSAGRISFTVLR